MALGAIARCQLFFNIIDGMIRKTIIVALTLGAVGTGLLCIDSYRQREPNESSIPYQTGWCRFVRHGENYDCIGVIVSQGTATLGRAVCVAAPRVEDRIFSFKTKTSTGITYAGDSIIRITLWHVGCLFAFYPTIVFIRGPLRRWRRRKKGLCLSCGYDLTGNESSVCPECGVKV